MKRIVEFPFAEGESIFVEVEEPESDRISRLDDAIEKAQNSFESVMDKLKPVANAVITRITKLP